MLRTKRLSKGDQPMLGLNNVGDNGGHLFVQSEDKITPENSVKTRAQGPQQPHHMSPCKKWQQDENNQNSSNNHHHHVANNGGPISSNNMVVDQDGFHHPNNAQYGGGLDEYFNDVVEEEDMVFGGANGNNSRRKSSRSGDYVMGHYKALNGGYQDDMDADLKSFLQEDVDDYNIQPSMEKDAIQEIIEHPEQQQEPKKKRKVGRPRKNSAINNVVAHVAVGTTSSKTTPNGNSTTTTIIRGRPSRSGSRGRRSSSIMEEEQQQEQQQQVTVVAEQPVQEPVKKKRKVGRPRKHPVKTPEDNVGKTMVPDSVSAATTPMPSPVPGSISSNDQELRPTSPVVSSRRPRGRPPKRKAALSKGQIKEEDFDYEDVGEDASQHEEVELVKPVQKKRGPGRPKNPAPRRPGPGRPKKKKNVASKDNASTTSTSGETKSHFSQQDQEEEVQPPVEAKNGTTTVTLGENGEPVVAPAPPKRKRGRPRKEEVLARQGLLFANTPPTTTAIMTGGKLVERNDGYSSSSSDDENGDGLEGVGGGLGRRKTRRGNNSSTKVDQDLASLMSEIRFGTSDDGFLLHSDGKPLVSALGKYNDYDMVPTASVFGCGRTDVRLDSTEVKEAVSALSDLPEEKISLMVQPKGLMQSLWAMDVIQPILNPNPVPPMVRTETNASANSTKKQPKAPSRRNSNASVTKAAVVPNKSADVGTTEKPAPKRPKLSRYNKRDLAGALLLFIDQQITEIPKLQILYELVETDRILIPENMMIDFATATKSTLMRLCEQHKVQVKHNCNRDTNFDLRPVVEPKLRELQLNNNSGNQGKNAAQSLSVSSSSSSSNHSQVNQQQQQQHYQQLLQQQQQQHHQQHQQQQYQQQRQYQQLQFQQQQYHHHHHHHHQQQQQYHHHSHQQQQQQQVNANQQGGSSFMNSIQQPPMQGYPYCVCGDKDTYELMIPCAGGQHGRCHGWVHPQCFNLNMQSWTEHQLMTYKCPLCYYFEQGKYLEVMGHEVGEEIANKDPNQQRCSFCSTVGPQTLTGDIVGPFESNTNRGTLYWVHRLCAIASLNTGVTEDGFWYNVANSVEQATQLPCVHCFLPGAGVRCRKRDTGEVQYAHLPCVFKQKAKQRSKPVRRAITHLRKLPHIKSHDEAVADFATKARIDKQTSLIFQLKAKLCPQQQQEKKK